ncbi:MAG: hypothetical protein ACRERX_15995 [Pseudomonas sp.]
MTTELQPNVRYSRNVVGSDIAVDTKSGSVTLGGKANSSSERTLAS